MNPGAALRGTGLQEVGDHPLARRREPAETGDFRGRQMGPGPVDTGRAARERAEERDFR